MPQILLGRNRATPPVARRPGTVGGHAFRWRAPDGSESRTEYLFDGYDNGLDVLLAPGRIGRASASTPR